jgi:ABC-type phosphate transport system substrate-binding protein
MRTHMKPARNFIAAVLIVFAAATVSAADFKVIANASVNVSQVSQEDLKGMFLITKTSFADGSHVVPVVLDSGSACEAFLKEYIGKTRAGLESYYRSLVFTGKGVMPKILASDAEVLAYVKKTKGAIGYVSPGADTEGVKLLEVK